MQIYCYVLSLLSTVPAGAASDGEHAPLPNPIVPPNAAGAQTDIPMVGARPTPAPRPAIHDWMLSVEAATRMPVDVGAQATLEIPYRLRVSAGYGWVPTTYSGFLTEIAGSASGNPQVAAILNHGRYQGRTFRTAIGVRPFATAGLHLDFGYTRIDLDGALDLASSGVPALESLGGGYQAHTSADAWTVEVGSQYQAWGVVFGFALGLTRIFSSQTSISAVNGAPTNPVLGAAAQQTDAALKSYGYVPTLALRLGFDLLAPRSWFADPSSHG